ncbi:hypothetical protein GCK32_011923 [Trichostrongylus colubriformis]|uniref:Uncharacterized protein n=1 Tax=Trichostrongylus colubriformis TaxID=6319 RepID=A0AAN8IVZ6_TRICO
MSSDVKVKCAGPPADVTSIPQLSSEAHPSMGVNSNGGESEAGYRARMNRLRLMKWKAKLARKFRRRLAL